MDEQEYSRALEYLLERLRTTGLTAVTNEINQRIRRGKTILKGKEDLVEKKIKQADVGKTQTLPLTPKESFESAIYYLKNIVLEFPLYQQSIRKTFGNHVVWMSDQNELLERVVNEDIFSLEQLTYNQEELTRSRIEFEIIEKIIAE